MEGHGAGAYGQATIRSPRLIRSKGDNYRVDGPRFFGHNDYRSSKARGNCRPEAERRRSESAPHGSRPLRSGRLRTGDACAAAPRDEATGSRRCAWPEAWLSIAKPTANCSVPLIDDIYVQPAAGDDGTSLGAALAVYLELRLPLPRNPTGHSIWARSLAMMKSKRS